MSRETAYAGRIGGSLLIFTMLLAGCQPDGPANTRTNSSSFTTVAERASFLHEYVTFRRTYETLDFDILYQDNGRDLVPGPSDWDVAWSRRCQPPSCRRGSRKA